MAPASATDAAPAPRPMTGVERSMCRGSVWPADCEVPEHGSVVNGALFFRRLPAMEAITTELCSVFSSEVRFQSLATKDGTWEPTTLDLNYHFVQEEAVAGQANAQRLVEDIIQQDLDHNFPLWRVHVVPVQDSRGLSIIVLRIHHCIGDGFAIASIFHSLARSEDGEPVKETALMRKLACEQQREQQTCSLATACNGVARSANRVRSLVSNSSVPFRPFETETKFTKPRAERGKGFRFGTRRHVVYVPAHSLQYVKNCKNAARMSVNDVVFSATSGALRRYCESRGDPAFVEGGFVRARALIPVANPDRGSQHPHDSLANNFGFVSCRMALSEAEPLDRLRQTSSNMSKIKRSRKAEMSLWQTNKLGDVFSERVNQGVARDLFSKHSLVFSNVPGPDVPIFIAGEPLEAAQAIFPNYLSQVILLSYNGRVHMNFTVDPEVVEDADSLADCYLAELRAIGSALGVEGDPLECISTEIMDTFALCARGRYSCALRQRQLEGGHEAAVVTDNMQGKEAAAAVDEPPADHADHANNADNAAENVTGGVATELTDDYANEY